MPYAVSLKGRTHLSVVTGKTEDEQSFESGHTRSFYSHRLKPHSHFTASSDGIHQSVKKPDRGSRDDKDHKRQKNRCESDTSQALYNPGLLSGEICISGMMSRTSPSKRLICLDHFPQPRSKFSCHGNSCFSFDFDVFQKMIVDTKISRIGANQSNSSLAESPTQVGRTSTRDFALRPFTAGILSTFSQPCVTSERIRTMKPMESCHLGDNDCSKDISDTRNSGDQLNFRFELWHIRKSENLSSDRYLLQFNTFHRLQKLRESKRRSRIQQMPLSQKPSACGITMNGSRSRQIMLVKNPPHPDFDVSQEFCCGVPVATDFSELPGGFVRNKRNRNIVFEHQFRNKPGINLIGFCLTFPCTISQFHSIDQSELVTDRFNKLPEPFIRTNRFNCTMDRPWQRGDERSDFINTFTVNLCRVYQNARIVAYGKSQRSLMKISPDMGLKTGGYHDQSPFVN